MKNPERRHSFYLLKKIKGSQDYRLKALELYQMLYQKTPRLEYREKTEELQQGKNGYVPK
ncbi:MAG: hypothetical protein Q8O74_05080 [bacterium]|nr:hypothetical protein [bacterium]